MMGRQGSQDNTEQLMRDLQGATEREQDLKDQLKFAEEEVSYNESSSGDQSLYVIEFLPVRTCVRPCLFMISSRIMVR